MQITDSRKMAGRKIAAKARWPPFFCPAFFCCRVRAPCFYKCVLTSGAVSGFRVNRAGIIGFGKFEIKQCHQPT
jgi:hypothetical protein